MIKKNIRRLLSLGLATGLLVAGTNASAKVIGYVTESNGVKYEYSQEDLIESILGKTELYERYQRENLIALVDDKNGYIDAEDVINAIISATMNGKNLDVSKYTESQSAKSIELKNVKRLDSNGELIGSDESPSERPSQEADDHIVSIEVDHHSMVSNVRVKGGADVFDIEVNGQRAHYEGDGSYSLGILGLSLGDAVEVKAYDDSGKLLASKKYVIK